MVVLLIMVILPAVAVPTFLGVTGCANDRAAQSDPNTAIATAETCTDQNRRSYGTGTTALTTTILTPNEPSLSGVSAAAPTQGAASIVVSTDGTGIILASPSKNDSCWHVADNLAYVTGNATTNGGYIDVDPSPGVGGTALTAPTRTGIAYGKATTTSRNAATLATPSRSASSSAP